MQKWITHWKSVRLRSTVDLKILEAQDQQGTEDEGLAGHPKSIEEGLTVTVSRGQEHICLTQLLK